jgi:hypothetical protein
MQASDYLACHPTQSNGLVLGAWVSNERIVGQAEVVPERALAGVGECDGAAGADLCDPPGVEGVTA